MSQCNMLASHTLWAANIVGEFIHTMIPNILIFHMDKNACRDLQTSWSHLWWILHQKIHKANGITVSLLQHNNPNPGVVHTARCMDKWCGESNHCDNIWIQADQPPRNNCWVCQQWYSSSTLPYIFGFCIWIDSAEDNHDSSIQWWKVPHDLLLGEDMMFLTPVMSDWSHGMIVCQYELQWEPHIVGVSKVITPVQIVLSAVDNQFL